MSKFAILCAFALCVVLVDSAPISWPKFLQNMASTSSDVIQPADDFDMGFSDQQVAIHEEDATSHLPIEKEGRNFKKSDDLKSENSSMELNNTATFNATTMTMSSTTIAPSGSSVIVTPLSTPSTIEVSNSTTTQASTKSLTSTTERYTSMYATSTMSPKKLTDMVDDHSVGDDEPSNPDVLNSFNGDGITNSPSSTASSAPSTSTSTTPFSLTMATTTLRPTTTSMPSTSTTPRINTAGVSPKAGPPSGANGLQLSITSFFIVLIACRMF